MGYTKLYSECRKCPYQLTCDHKRLEEHGLLEPAGAFASQPLTQPLLRPHDYRQVKIDTDTTVTIDLEEVKVQLAESFSPPMLFQGGA